MVLFKKDIPNILSRFPTLFDMFVCCVVSIAHGFFPQEKPSSKTRGEIHQPTKSGEEPLKAFTTTTKTQRNWDKSCRDSQHEIHSPSLTWNLKMMVSKRNLLFQGAIFRFHVKLWEGMFFEVSVVFFVNRQGYNMFQPESYGKGLGRLIILLTLSMCQLGLCHDVPKKQKNKLPNFASKPRGGNLQRHRQNSYQSSIVFFMD